MLNLIWDFVPHFTTLSPSLKKKFSKGLSAEEINKRVAEDGWDGVGGKIRILAISKNLESTLVRDL